MSLTAELLVFSSDPAERRRSQRLKPAEPVRTLVGRGTGTLADLSATGARIRHTFALVRGAQVRVTFDWQGQAVEAVAEVLGSRVTGISSEGTLFESRVRFRPLSEASADVLDRVLLDMGNRDLRKWVSNLHGWSAEEAPAPPAPRPATTFLRCRLLGEGWQKQISHDPAAPPDGFTVATGTDPSEIRALCRTFEQTDADGRRLLQHFTNAVLQQTA